MSGIAKTAWRRIAKRGYQGGVPPHGLGDVRNMMTVDGLSANHETFG
jgi:hypothetical protein